MENPFEEKQHRPTLLTVICVLTFIGSGWGVLSSLFSLFTAGMTDNSMYIEQFSSMTGDMEEKGGLAIFSNFLNDSVQVLQAEFVHAKEIATFHLILGVIGLVGAILMFQLRRLGFYLYTTAQILNLLIYPYFVGLLLPVVMQMFLSGLVAAVFIVLYAVNLKYMK